MDKYQIFIESSLIPLTQVKPVFSGLFDYSRESGTVYYTHELADKLKFSIKADFALLKMQDENDDCEDVIITIYKRCSEEYVLEWTGVFKTFEATMNYSRCYAVVTPKQNAPYKCFEEAFSEDQNIYSSGSAIEVSSLGGEYETKTCSGSISNATFEDYYLLFVNPPEACLNGELGWAVKSHVMMINGTEYNDIAPYDEPEPYVIDWTTIWHREVITIDCVLGVPQEPPFGSGWVLNEDNCGVDNTSEWVRSPNTGDVIGPYRTGREFSEVIEKVLQNMGCGLTVKSDFFNINPEADSPSNTAYTFAQNNLHNLTLHQKSDIKRKNASNASTFELWEITAEDFFNDLAVLFNVFPKPIGDKLILEHYSFYENQIGPDYSNESMMLQVENTGNNNVKLEKFIALDEASSSDFKAKPITYPCGTETKENRCRLFSLDIAYIENEENSERISDEGFVLIANELYEGNYIVINNNLPLSFNNLLENLHKDGRLFKAGTLNNTYQDFDSWWPYRKQEPFTVTSCCSDSFDPEEKVTTKLGEGTVIKASKNIITGKLKLELNY